jgi:hypothetical protein
MKKYIIALLLLAQPLTAFANFSVFSPDNPLFKQKQKTEYILLETTDGEWIQWPKNLIPAIRIYSVSTKHERHAIYKFIVRDKTKRYEIPITEESYTKYKKIMGI